MVNNARSSYAGNRLVSKLPSRSLEWFSAWLALPLVFGSAGVPTGAATHQGPQDLNAVDLNLLVYHPFPDEQGDPWGLPVLTVNETSVDWMRGYYGAFFYPTAVFDGVEVVESTPAGEGGGAFQETRRVYQGLMESRRDQDSPLTIRLEGQWSHHQLMMNATLDPHGGPLEEGGLVARFVLFEDDVAYNGGNGILNHRFVVREFQLGEPVDFPTGRPVELQAEFTVPRFVEVENVGVVLFVQNADESSRRFEWKEVVQAATWTSRQAGPTIQASKGVLLELYSATWCAACVYGDSATDELANEFGVLSGRVLSSPYEYLRPGPWWQVLTALAFGGIVVGLLVRQARRRGPGKQEAEREP